MYMVITGKIIMSYSTYELVGKELESTGQTLKFSSSYKFTKFLGISSNAHILDVLNKKRISVKGWEVKYDL